MHQIAIYSKKEKELKVFMPRRELKPYECYLSVQALSWLYLGRV